MGMRMVRLFFLCLSPFFSLYPIFPFFFLCPALRRWDGDEWMLILCLTVNSRSGSTGRRWTSLCLMLG